MIDKINSSIPTQIQLTKKSTDKVSTFSETLGDYIKSVSNDQLDAKHSIERFLRGEEKDIHNTMITIQKADISLQLMMQVRSKLITAYQELMRIQI